MSFYPNASGRSAFSLLSLAFAFCPDARFTGLLAPSFFQSLADKHSVSFGQGHDDTFCPSVTVWTWLGQALRRCCSCAGAVSRVVLLFVSLGRSPCSSDSGAFCKARAKLPEPFLRDLTVELGKQIEANALDEWKWRGRTVKFADGTLVRLVDTAENLQEFPQQRSQKKGLSSTTLRVVVLLAFATAALTEAAYGPYRGKGSGEMSLLLQTFASIAPGEVLVGDRYYGSYLLLALLLRRGADGCFRLPVSRQKDFHQGQRLGEDDYLQTWPKPRRPKTVDKQTWDSLPDQITVRVSRVAIAQRGFRSEEVYVVSTLGDASQYSKADVGSLYFGRWNVEVDIRSIKQGLGLAELSCKSPEMVKSELWVHLLAYNLVRCAMAQAALDKGLKPRDLSFAGAVDTLTAFGDLLSLGQKDGNEMREVISKAIARHRVGKRPGRSEPREVKRKPRKYKELKKPRKQRREELQTQKGGKKDKGRGKDRPSGR